MKVTINQLKRELKEIADKHRQLNAFHFGEILDIQEAHSLTNCTLFCNISTGNLSESYIDLTLSLMVLDKCNTDKENYTDIESDTLQIINDIYSVLWYSNKWQNLVKLSGNPSINKMYEYTDSILIGWQMNLQVRIKKDKGVCATAFNGYNFE